MKFKLVESKEDWEKLKKHLETRDYTDPTTYINLFKKMKDRLPKEERDIYY